MSSGWGTELGLVQLRQLIIYDKIVRSGSVLVRPLLRILSAEFYVFLYVFIECCKVGRLFVLWHGVALCHSMLEVFLQLATGGLEVCVALSFMAIEICSHSVLF